MTGCALLLVPLSSKLLSLQLCIAVVYHFVYGPFFGISGLD